MCRQTISLRGGSGRLLLLREDMCRLSISLRRRWGRLLLVMWRDRCKRESEESVQVWVVGQIQVVPAKRLGNIQALGDLDGQAQATRARLMQSLCDGHKEGRQQGALRSGQSLCLWSSVFVTWSSEPAQYSVNKHEYIKKRRTNKQAVTRNYLLLYIMTIFENCHLLHSP